MKYKIFFTAVIIFSIAFAAGPGRADSLSGTEEIFKAKVLEVMEHNEIKRDDGSISIRQKLRLKGLDGGWQGREFIFDSGGVDVLSGAAYKAGDKVMVSYSPGPDGEDNFYVLGFARSGSLYWLAFLFALAVIAIGRRKGFRALIVLALTFFIILYFIIPRILAGGNPLFISIIGSFFILVLAIYITEGLKKSSTIAILAVLLSLIITGIISAWFTSLAKLTGFAGDEAIYLIGLAGGAINTKGLLLAGIIIGALGVLDDVVISQVMLVRELKNANPGLTRLDIYRRAMKVGVSHLSSMVNTLFLAYAGAALPLLILFSVNEPPFLDFSQVISDELVATEIVRALAGSIGLVLAVPLSTLLAVRFLKAK